MHLALRILVLGVSLALPSAYAQADSACSGLRGRDLQQAGVAGLCGQDLAQDTAAAAETLLDNDAGDGGNSDDRPDPPARSDNPGSPGSPDGDSDDPSGDPVDP
jgi:hypothetical protein